MSNELMKVNYEINGQEIVLTQDDVKRYLVNGNADKVTDKEFKLFMELCKAQKLNPFLKEAYLIKFGQDANIIVGKDVFLKRAKNNPTFKGFKAGVLIINGKGLEKREGTFYMSQQEQLVGGWASVYVDGWEVPLENSVSLQEFNKGTATWKSMPAVMIRKVALVQALREAFPDDLQGLYDSSEMGTQEPNHDNLNSALAGTFFKHHGDDCFIEDDDVIEEIDEDDLLIGTINREQAKQLFKLANGDAELVREIIEDFGFEKTEEITLELYGDIMQAIQEAKE